MIDLEGLALELNQMHVGQAYTISAWSLSELRWNWMEYGQGTEGLKRALRAKLIGSAYGTFDFVHHHHTGGITVVRKEESARIFTRDGDPMPDILKSIEMAAVAARQAGEQSALIVFTSEGYDRFRAATDHMITTEIPSGPDCSYTSAFSGIPFVEDDLYDGHRGGAEYQLLSTSQARAYYAAKSPTKL